MVGPVRPAQISEVVEALEQVGRCLTHFVRDTYQP